jgi:hypothetical protein
MPQIILVKGDEKGSCMNSPSYSTGQTYILYMEVVIFINSNPYGCGVSLTLFSKTSNSKKTKVKKTRENKLFHGKHLLKQRLAFVPPQKMSFSACFVPQNRPHFLPQIGVG